MLGQMGLLFESRIDCAQAVRFSVNKDFNDQQARGDSRFVCSSLLPTLCQQGHSQLIETMRRAIGFALVSRFVLLIQLAVFGYEAGHSYLYLPASTRSEFPDRLAFDQSNA